MKKIIGLLIVGFYFCCTTNTKQDDVSHKRDTISVKQNKNIDQILFADDSIVNRIIKNGISELPGIGLIKKPAIKFASGYSDDFSYTRYQISFEGNNIDFIDTVYETRKVNMRNVYLNNKRLDLYKVNNDVFNLDSLEVHIVYTESEIYNFQNIPYYLLIVSHPMNWVGSMTKFSYFQLINLKAKKVIEFVSEQ